MVESQQTVDAISNGSAQAGDASLDEIIERFQDQWSPDRRQLIRTFLPDRESIRFAALAALVSVDLELSLRSGLDVRPESYFAIYPELSKCREIAVALYSKTFRLRAQTNSQLTWRDFLETVPSEWRDDLRPPVRYLRTSVRLGHGGQAEVWRAMDHELGRVVALKVFRPEHHDERSRQRFKAEAKIICDLEHPSIVPIYGSEETIDGRISYAMQLLNWPTLTRRIDECHKAEAATPQPENESFRRLLSHFISVCNAVAFAHDRGYLHLDLKPSNILVGDYGETMVMDWGLAMRSKSGRRRGERSSAEDISRETASPVLSTIDLQPSSMPDGPISYGTEQVGGTPVLSTIGLQPSSMPDDPISYDTEQVVGTPAYMSSEQARGETRRFSEATDVFGLGGILYQILINRPPYSSESDAGPQGRQNGMRFDAFMSRVKSGQYLPPRMVRPLIPKPLDAICNKAMNKEPENRYQSAKQLASDVERWLANEPVDAYAETVTEKFWRWMRRHHQRVFTIAGIAILAIILVFSAWGIITREIHKAKVHGAITTLVQADPSMVQGLIADLSKDTLALAELRRRLESAQRDLTPDLPKIQRYRLGLLLSDAKMAESLVADAFRANSDREFFLVRNTLALYKPQIADSLLKTCWKALEQPDAQTMIALRSAALLAVFDEKSDRWAVHGHRIANELLQLSPSGVAQWSPAFLSVRQVLVPPVRSLFLDEQQPLAVRLSAADVLSNYLARDNATLVSLLGDSHHQQHSIIFARLAENPEASLVALRAAAEVSIGRLEIATDVANSVTESRRLARFQAALLRFGTENFDWQLLRASSNPTVRTELIHFLPRCQLPDSTLVTGFQKTSDPDIRAAILLCLGEYPLQYIPSTGRDSWVRQLELKDVVTTHHPGLRAAARWLLLKLSVETSDSWLNRSSEKAGDGTLTWYLTSTNGHEMIVLPQKVFGGHFMMGDIGNVTEFHEAGLHETVHNRRIARSFAMANCETSMVQYEAFLNDYHRGDPNMPFPVDEWIDDDRRRVFDLNRNGPAIYVNWMKAATYCNWLSRQEGLDPVYPMEIEKVAFAPLLPGDEIPSQIALPQSLLQRNGYRLPTEAEWEVACRAGTSTPWHFGFDKDWLRRYAHYRSSDRAAPLTTAELKPNAWGFFDILGNAMEWCHHTAEYPEEQTEMVFDDDAGGSDQIAIRGGSCQNLPEFVRSSYRLRHTPSISAIDIGFRVVRTIPSDDALLQRGSDKGN